MTYFFDQKTNFGLRPTLLKCFKCRQTFGLMR